MGFAKKIAAAIAAIIAVPAIACAATIGGVYYAPQYDYTDFWAASDNKTFQVVLEGNPFPSMAADEMAQRLLPVMQIAKPRPNLTFTYDKPAEMRGPTTGWSWCSTTPTISAPMRSARARCAPPRRRPAFSSCLPSIAAMTWRCRRRPPGRRRAARTIRAYSKLFRELFMVVFTDSPAVRPQNNFDRR